MIDLSKALQVNGWMSEPELQWLAETAHVNYPVIEIGSYMGRSTRAMADNCPGTIFAVDTWEGSADMKADLADKPKHWLFSQFEENLFDHLMSKKVIPFQLPSLEAAKYCAQLHLSFGMVFIDASHEYADVKADILAWRPLVRLGGVLCGHDYDWGYPGVVYAVRELIAEVPNQAAGGSSLWYQEM